MRHSMTNLRNEYDIFTKSSHHDRNQALEAQYFTAPPPQPSNRMWKHNPQKSVSEGNLWTGRKKLPVEGGTEFMIFPAQVGDF